MRIPRFARQGLRRAASRWRWLAVQSGLLLACLGVYGLATVQVHQYERDVQRQTFTLEGRINLPMLVFTPVRQPINVIVIIAHGYSANKEMMSAFGVDLAKQGVTTYTFDFPGHGASTIGYSGVPELVDSVGEVVNYAIAHAQAPHPKLALIGYSLGTIAVGEYALQHPELSSLSATVLVAGILQAHPTVSNPRNLLVLSGQFDLPGINAISTNLISSGCGVPPAAIASTYQCDVSGIYGHRERIILSGLNHISIVTATSTHTAVIHWLGQYVDPRIGIYPVNADVRLHWLLLGLLAAGLGMLPLLSLGSALAGLLPAVAPASADVGAGPRLQTRLVLGMLAAALAVALLIQRVILPQSFWAPPTIPFLAQQVSADVATFLLIAAALLAGEMLYLPALLRRQNLPALRGHLARLLRAHAVRQVALGALVAVYVYFTLGSLSTFAWEGLTLTPPRAWRAIAYAVMLWPFFFGTQALLTALAARRSLRATLTELAATGLLLAALVTSIVLNFTRLSYLGILLPVFAIVLLAMVGVNAWARRVAAPSALLLATMETLILAWALAATLPLTS